MVVVLLCSLLVACVYGGVKTRQALGRRLGKIQPPPTSAPQGASLGAPSGRELGDISLEARRLSRRVSRSGVQMLVEEPEDGEEEARGRAETPRCSAAPQLFDGPRL